MFTEILTILLSVIILIILNKIAVRKSIFFNECGYDNYKKCSAVLISCAESDSIDLTVEDWVNSGKRISSELGMNRNVLIVTPSENKKIYNDMYCEYVVVNRVVEGDDSLTGINLELYSDTRGFYYEDMDTYKRRIARLSSLGYSKEKYPEYYERSVQYRNNLNLLMPEHEYLICVDSYSVGDENIYFVSYSMFPYFDITNSDSISVEEGSLDKYSNYCNNEIFASNQKFIDSYSRLKNEVFEYYKIVE